MMAGAALFSAVTYVPILAREYLGTNEFYVTFLVGAYATASFVSSYIFGRAGDVYGRRVILRLGLLLCTISFGLLLIAIDPVILFLIRILNGFCIGMYPGALAAFAYESEMKMGRFAAFGAVGWGIGTVTAGFAAGFWIYGAFLVSTSFFALAFGSAMTLPKAPHQEMDVPLFPVATLKRNWSVYTAVLVRHSSASALWTLWPLFLFDIGADFFWIGVIQATNAISQVAFMAGMTDRFECRKLVATGLLASAATFTSLVFVTNVLEAIPTQVILGFAWSCLYVGALKYVTERNLDRSTASGLLTSVMSISGVLGPIFATVLFALWPGYHAIMIFAALMSTMGLLIFAGSSRNEECDITYPPKANKMPS